MKKILAGLIFAGALVFTVAVFAQQEQQVAANTEMSEPVADTPSDADAVVNDEGYGNDAEYFGAEVNGIDDGTLEEEAPAVNAEVDEAAPDAAPEDAAQ